MNRVVETMLAKARTRLYITQPFYGILSLRMVLKEVVNDPRVETLSVNYTTIYYNPDFVTTLSPELLMSAICHELQHVILDHMDRENGRERKRWNAACDYVVNALLKQDGMQISPSWLYDRAYEGMTAEHIYTLLPPGSGGAMDAMSHSSSAAEAATSAAAWEMAVVNAAASAKAAGKLPASIARTVDELTKGKVNWRERLRRFVTVHAKNDFSWSRPQRRMIPFGYYLPSLHSEAMDALVVAIDTSGSIDAYTLNLFGSEVIAAKDAARPSSLSAIYCDARVNHVDTFAEHDHVHFDIHGGGGTDFRPPFEYIDENSLKPSCFIYLTDGLGPFPAKPPPYPVLWVMTTGVVAPWGETIRIEA